ncbi:MAG: hypothetical protein OQL19_10870 [Gammaproteobacteria bacterium]|nr:hypothetical protein [Gammaproteobacteria bacterium]
MNYKFILFYCFLLIPCISYGEDFSVFITTHIKQSKQCVQYPGSLKHQTSCAHQERFVPRTPSAEELYQMDYQQAWSFLKKGDKSYENDDYAGTERAYRQALKLLPNLPDAWLKLAAFYSNLNRDKDALQILQNSLIQISDNADIYHEMGLLQVRLRIFSEAIVSLAKAALLAPENPHYSYVYGIAMNSFQRTDEALDILYKAHLLHLDNKEILTGLMSINEDNDNHVEALKYAEKLIVLEPENTALKNYIIRLKK